MNNQPGRVTRPKPSGRALAFAAAYGAIATTIAYVVARGNPFWMLVVMVVISVLFRLYAYSSTEPALVDALHAWFDRQNTDHAMPGMGG